eukprot:1310477-Amphidinium_carterae.1
MAIPKGDTSPTTADEFCFMMSVLAIRGAVVPGWQQQRAQDHAAGPLRQIQGSAAVAARLHWQDPPDKARTMHTEPY